MVPHADGFAERPAPIPLVILGADAYLAARPATPVQVDHACRAAGYAAAIPATWGDELLATACAQRLATRAQPTAIFCSCQRVRDRLLGPGPDLLPFLVSFVAPPVATARYVQRLYGDVPLDITYVGNCPSANSDPAIARQLRPEDFLASLKARGIIAAQEPLVYNSFFAPDRRRFASLPGGLPIDRVLQEPQTAGGAVPADSDSSSLPLVPRSVVDIRELEYAAELAQYLITGAPVLLDVGPRLGCACSGAVSGVALSSARSAVMALEPPRAPGPVVETDTEIDIDLDPRIEEEVSEPLVEVATSREPAPVVRSADREVEWRGELAAMAMPAAPGESPRVTPAPKGGTATWTASWLASCVLDGPDQLGSDLGAPGSSTTTTDRGAGVP